MAAYELVIEADGRLLLPLGLLAEAGIDPGAAVFAVSPVDGRIVLRRLNDATEDLLGGLPPV